MTGVAEAPPALAGRRRWWIAILIGAAAGLLSGMFGVGGGVLIVPALVLVMGLDQRLAHGTSLAAIVPISISGVIGYGFHGLVDWPAAGLLILGAIGGAVVGTRLLDRIPQRALRYTFAGLMIVTAARLFLELPETTTEVDLTWPVGLALVGTGLVVGVLSGLLGVGGGIFLVPIMVLFFGIDDDLAKGTSLLVVIPTGLVATVGNLRRGNADLTTAVTVGVAGILSAFLGVQLAVLMSSRLSLVLFACLLLVTAVRLAAKKEPAATRT